MLNTCEPGWKKFDPQVNTSTMAANVNLLAPSANDDYLALPEQPAEDADTTAESSQFSESSSPLAHRKRVRTPTALDIWAESRQPNRHEPGRNKHSQKIWYCKRYSYSQAAHNRVRGHLRDKHCVLISEQQTAKKLGQGVAIDRLFRRQAARQNGLDVERERYLRTSVDEDAYNQALVNLITAHSLPHSLVEWPEWYALLHTVNQWLQESSRTAVGNFQSCWRRASQPIARI